VRHSERRLVEEVHLNLAYRWFCGLDLKGEVPERSSFSKTRHGRFRESDAFRIVFENVLQTCLREGLIGGETFAEILAAIFGAIGPQPPLAFDPGLGKRVPKRVHGLERDSAEKCRERRVPRPR
jgi:Transposase domain (DUF772)